MKSCIGTKPTKEVWKKRLAEREDGQLLILPSEISEEAGALSGPTFDSPNEKLSPGSEMRLTETPSVSEGPDLVPTSDNQFSDGKVTDSASYKQEGRVGSSLGERVDVYELANNQEDKRLSEADKPAFSIDEKSAGTKHSLFRHFETKSNYIMADDIAMVPEIIAKGERPVIGKKIVYDYVTAVGTSLSFQ